MSKLVTRKVLCRLLRSVAEHYGRAGIVYLVGETSQVFASWRDWTAQVDLASDVSDPSSFAAALEAVSSKMGIVVLDEFPGDLIPLPEGHESRARPAGFFGDLKIRHFDPYSTAFRFIARGDEPDYHLVLAYLKHRWIDRDEMDRHLARLIPRFSVETIQQDPAEFRRKYKGLLQMAQAIEPGTVHRHTQS